MLRAGAFGAFAVASAYVVGFVVSGFQNPLALVIVFVMVAIATMVGSRQLRDWVELHARLSAIVLAASVVILPLAIIWLVQPTYIGPAN